MRAIHEINRKFLHVKLNHPCRATASGPGSFCTTKRECFLVVFAWSRLTGLQMQIGAAAARGCVQDLGTERPNFLVLLLCNRVSCADSERNHPKYAPSLIAKPEPSSVPAVVGIMRPRGRPPHRKSP